ncbi:hypothetical protein CIK06_10280 [Plantactinospora sp. KBS50]|nr:hypothetical protein CIK06_10280 [Plantactinospora sp. KBS50]
MALLLGGLGFGYRLVLILLTIPGGNSDEATFGIAALHIAAGTDRPVFLYGQRYMGTVESYLAAPLFAVAGPSWPALRLPLLALWALFVLASYRLTRRICSPWLATFTVGLLALGSERVIRDQLTAVGGRPEVKPALVVLLLVVLDLGERRIRWRWPAYALFGVLAGLVLWDDWLALPYLAAAGVALVAVAGRQLVGRAGLVLAGGLALGLLPLILDNLRAPPGQDSLSVLRELSHGESAPASLGQRLHGAVEIGLPLATGTCPADGCVPGRLWWAGCYLVLLLAAAVLAVVELRRDGGRARAAVRLALVVGAGLSLVGYVRNDLAGTAPLASARYLALVQISLPILLWPPWRAAARLVARWPGRARPGRGQPDRAGWLTRVVGGGSAALLAALTVAMLWATADFVHRLGPVRAEQQDARRLAAAVRQAGVRYVYGEYWTCNRLVFDSAGRLDCAVLGADLRPGQNRWSGYWDSVGAAPRPAFLFGAGSAADRAFTEFLAREGVAVPVQSIGAYRLYQPQTRLRPWR